MRQLRAVPPGLRLPGLLICAFVLVELAVPFLGLQSPVRMNILHRFAGPSMHHWLGQDEYGRDELARLLWGGRASLTVAAGSAGLACTAGVALGLVGGFLGRVAELFAVRSMDLLLCFPPLLLALLVVTLCGPGGATLIAVLAVVYLPGFVRLVYAGVLSVRAQDYVAAMQVLGASRLRIMLRTILPNIAGPVVVQLGLTMASAVLLESGLSFLGLGVVPPAPSWGLMIAAARSTMSQAPILLLWPCVALSLTVLTLNALCDGLRDALDPHAPHTPRGAARLLERVAPGLWKQGQPNMDRDAVLAVTNLTVAIDTASGLIYPVRDVSIAVAAGEVLAIVGESGSGKSLTGLAVMGLLPAAARVVAGDLQLEGQTLLGLDETALRDLRGRRMAMVFQDPLSSLNPVHRLGAQIGEALDAHRNAHDFVRGPELRERVLGLLSDVGIADPKRVMAAYPQEVSGGMRQRVMIAMAIANHPAFLIADEPTTALDVTTQAQILGLLGRLTAERRMGMVLVTHSLPVVAESADRVAVMYAGEIVEQGHVNEVLARPRHPYTAALLRAAPGTDGALPDGIGGQVPPPHALPAGCVFAPRCAYRQPACETERPALVETGPDHLTRCRRWMALEYSDAGIGVSV